MTITTVTLYETEDGKQHKTFEAAQHWERRRVAHAAIENCRDLTRDEVKAVCNFFDAIDADERGRFKSEALAAYLHALAHKIDPIKHVRAE